MPKKLNMAYLKALSTNMIKKLSRQTIDLDEVFSEFDRMAEIAERLEPITVSQRIGRTIGNACMVIFNDMQNTAKVPVEERRAAFTRIIAQVRAHLDDEFPGDDQSVYDLSTPPEGVEEVSEGEEADDIEEVSTMEGSEEEEEEEEDEEITQTLGTLHPPPMPATQVHAPRKRERAPSPEREEHLTRQNAVIIEE